MSEAIQDAIAALEDERTVMDQKIATVRDAVMERIDQAIDTLRGLAGGAVPARGAGKTKSAARGNKQTNKQTNKARLAPARSAEPP